MFHYYHETGQAQEYLMNGSFEGEITWTAGETGFTPHVLEQVKSTLQKWENDIRWEQSNEYDRFISDVEKHDNYKDVKGVV